MTIFISIKNNLAEVYLEKLIGFVIYLIKVTYSLMKCSQKELLTDPVLNRKD